MSQTEIYAEFFDRFGLNKIDQEVYGVLIGKGVMTPGEITETLGNRGLLEVLESLRDLVDFGLVTVVGEKIKRYYANFPFLREILTVEREAIISLASLIDSIDEKWEILGDKRKEMEEVTFPMLINHLLDSYYTNILKPLRDNLVSKREDAEIVATNSVKAISDFRDILQEEITKMTVPLDQLTKLAGTKMTLSLTDEQGKLEEYIKQRKTERVNLLKNAHFQLSSFFKETEDQFDKLNAAISNPLEQLKKVTEEVDTVISSATKLKETTEQAWKANLDQARQLREGILLTRETLVKGITQQLEDPVQQQQVEKMIRDAFDALGEIVKEPDMTVKEEALEKLNPLVSELPPKFKLVQEALKAVQKEGQNSLLKAKGNFKDTLSQVGGIFNEINTNDDKSLNEIREAVQAEFKDLTKKLAARAKEATDQLEGIEEAMKQSVSDAFAAYEDDLTRAFNAPIKLIDENAESLKEMPLKDKEAFEEQVKSTLANYMAKLKEEEEEAITLLKERIEFAKAMVEGRSLDLRKILRATEAIEIKVPVDNGVIIGLPAIYASLTDLLLRARRKVTLITPTFDSTLFGLAISLVRNSPSTRITIVTHIPEGKRTKELETAEQYGTITVYNYEAKDLYACFRDDEEILFGYKREGEEVSAIRSASYSMVELFKDRVNETVIRKSKRLV